MERWGEPDSSKCILAASILDREHDPVSVLFSFLLLEAVSGFFGIFNVNCMVFWIVGRNMAKRVATP